MFLITAVAAVFVQSLQIDFQVQLLHPGAPWIGVDYTEREQTAAELVKTSNPSSVSVSTL